MSITERILLYLEYKGVSKYKFYKETGLSNGFLDKNGNIGSDKCEKICNSYTDLNIEWLITGKGEMIKRRDDTTIINHGSHSSIVGSAEVVHHNNHPKGTPINKEDSYKSVLLENNTSEVALLKAVIDAKDKQIEALMEVNAMLRERNKK